MNKPTIVKKDGFMVVGLKYRGKNEQNEVPQLWQSLMPVANQIRHIVPHGAIYGIMDNYDETTGEFDYIAGFEVSQLANIPRGMVGVAVPARTYAVFEATLATLREAYNYAYQWLPMAAYESVPGPEFEMYDETFDPHDPDSLLYIYLPVKQRIPVVA